MNNASRSRLLMSIIMGIVTVFFFSGCGDPLDDRYGTTDVGSINGCSILKTTFEQQCDLHVAHLLSSRLEDNNNLLIHVARQQELPDEEVCEWLESWLLAESHRQVVLVLKNGSLTSWLCRRWAKEARAEADKAPDQATSLRAMAQQLEKRADADEEKNLIELTKSCKFFTWHIHPEITPMGITGLELTNVPLTMRLGGFVTTTKTESITKNKGKQPKKPEVVEEEPEPAIPLIQAQTSSSLIPGGKSSDEYTPWAVELRKGNFSRLVVVTDALPLLDGAQPDLAARKLMLALSKNIIEFHGEKPQASWVNHLRVRGEGGPPNPLVAVLTTPPICWISWHLIALLIVLAFSGAGWLGRREAPRDYRQERFSRHVLALAAKLRDTHQASWCARAIARVTLRYREAPPTLTTEDSAREWLRTTANGAMASSSPLSLPSSSPSSLPATQHAPKRSP
jgi:hypothetical protein